MIDKLLKAKINIKRLHRHRRNEQRHKDKISIQKDGHAIHSTRRFPVKKLKMLKFEVKFNNMQNPMHTIDSPCKIEHLLPSKFFHISSLSKIIKSKLNK